MKIWRVIVVSILFCCFLFAVPGSGWSKLVAAMYEASGTVEKVLADGTVLLDGEMYYLTPNRKTTDFQIQAGSQIILHYVQDGDKKIYFNIASERDLLPQKPVVSDSKTRRYQ